VDLKSPRAPVNSEKVYENGVRVDWKSSPKHLPKVRRRFGKARTTVDSEKVHENIVVVDWKIITETPSKGDAWIQKRSQPLLTQKKSTKQLPKETRGFVSAPKHC
jgi:hypothetical protein